MEHLVGTAEIAERLGMASPEIVLTWRRRYPDFPQPIAKLQIGMVFNWPEVERWAKATGRL